ncbi:hypothetical protein IE53DRAFT_385433 [Violaceomyces palustris]|uniref:Uncharacterized protein n=1 Tax=Violaceomyces palustris TaxID=1673888 RepID=A0ACD0P283_9BASI|nr:hypothetical protein IE53DRAFT_385433 [Violaceomyces palustris]
MGSAKPVPSPSAPAESAPDPNQLTQHSLRILHQFLSLVDPHSASLLPSTEDDSSASHGGPAKFAREIPISEWNILYQSTSPAKSSANTPSSSLPPFTPSITVRSHPDPNRHLFSVQSIIPGVNARQFWSLMASSENRRLWDSTVEEGGVKRWVAKELLERQCPSSDSPVNFKKDVEGTPAAAMAQAMASRVELLRFGSIFMVAKPRDMVLLSVDARLPPTPDSTHASADPTQAPLRLISASQSIVDSSLPPKKGYTRFQLNCGGFMVEDLGDDGVDCDGQGLAGSKSPRKDSLRQKGLNALRRRKSNSSHSESPSKRGIMSGGGSGFRKLKDPRGPALMVTQVSDLGEMAAWVPSSVIKMVASSLVPRSIASIAKVAKGMGVPRAVTSDAARSEIRTREGKKDWDAMEKLGSSGGLWHSHRCLPNMVGQGALSKASEPGLGADEEDSVKREELESLAEVGTRTGLSDAEGASHSQPKAANIKDDQVEKDASMMEKDASMQELSISPATLPAFSSNFKNLLLQPTEPRLLASSISADSVPPPSPGVSSESEAGIEDQMSSTSSLSTSSGPFKGRKQDLSISLSPSEGGTDTIPGSMISSDVDLAARDPIRRAAAVRSGIADLAGLYGLTSEHLRRATLHLAEQDEKNGGDARGNGGAKAIATEVQEGSREEGDGEVVALPDRATPNQPFSPLPAKRTSSLINSSQSNHNRGLSSDSYKSSKKPSHHKRFGTLSGHEEARELDRRLNRMSLAIVAEMERRQEARKEKAEEATHAQPEIHLPPSDDPPDEVSLEGPYRKEPREETKDIIDLLAEALSHEVRPPSLESASDLGEGVSRSAVGFDEQLEETREQATLRKAQRLSAMLLAGSDALAMALAPGARETLSLGFDGLSTPSEGSEPQTPIDTSLTQSQGSDYGEGEDAFSSGSLPPALSSRVGLGMHASASTSSLSLLAYGHSSRGRSPSVSASSASGAPAAPTTTSTHVFAASMSSSMISSSSSFNSSSSSQVSPKNPLGRTEGATERLMALRKASGSGRFVPSSSKAGHRFGEGESVVPRRSGPSWGQLPYTLVLGMVSLAWTSSTSSKPSSTEGIPTAQPTATVMATSPVLSNQTSSSSLAPASSSSQPRSPKIPSKGSAPRKKSRENYKYENNAKLHPFPGSLGYKGAKELKLPALKTVDWGDDDGLEEEEESEGGSGKGGLKVASG